jgi:hypothetical protein
MTKMKSHAQVDNTLIMSVSGLLTGRMADPIADVTNLMTFAHAVILFDRVAVPVWDINLPATDYLPSSILPKGIFEDAVDQDFQQRIQDCIEQSFVMGSSSKSLPIQPGQSITGVVSLTHQILSAEGKAWPSAFQKHVHHIAETQTELVTREIGRIMNGYSIDAAFLSLPIEEKAALTYLWRCLYNISLSVEKQRPYLHNVYRLPFMNAIYHHIEDQRLSLSWSEEIMPRRPKAANSQPLVYKVLLPSLLGSILSSIKTREQIIPKVLEIRESREARAFRSHYAELQEKLGEPSASLELEKDIEHLINLWAGFVDPVPIPIMITHHDWTGFGIQPLVPPRVVSWVGRLYTRLSKRHLRFAIHLLENPKYYRQLNDLVSKTFGLEYRKSLSHKTNREVGKAQ